MIYWTWKVIRDVFNRRRRRRPRVHAATIVAADRDRKVFGKAHAVFWSWLFISHRIWNMVFISWSPELRVNIIREIYPIHYTLNTTHAQTLRCPLILWNVLLAHTKIFPLYVHNFINIYEVSACLVKFSASSSKLSKFFSDTFFIKFHRCLLVFRI